MCVYMCVHCEIPPGAVSAVCDIHPCMYACVCSNLSARRRFGAPPTAATTLAALDTLIVDAELKEHLTHDCGVCKDEFDIGAEVTMLPCTHYFHKVRHASFSVCECEEVV